MTTLPKLNKMYTHPDELVSTDNALLARRVSEADFQSIIRARKDAVDWFLNLPLKMFRGIFKRKTAK